MVNKTACFGQKKKTFEGDRIGYDIWLNIIVKNIRSKKGLSYNHNQCHLRVESSHEVHLKVG